LTTARAEHAVAQGLAAGCTGQEAVARWGGEAFALLLTAVEEASARARVEEPRAVVGTVRVPWEGRNLRITASVGAVWLRAARVNLAPCPIDQYMAYAIAALCTAKQAGRNRTVWHGAAETDGKKG
jgi:diguanylate cyclase (GGDEF)-like protein